MDFFTLFFFMIKEITFVEQIARLLIEQTKTTLTLEENQNKTDEELNFSNGENDVSFYF